MATPQKRQSKSGNKSFKTKDQVVDVTSLDLMPLLLLFCRRFEELVII